MGIKCCLNCKKRHLNCHSKCDIYIKEKEIIEKEKEEARKEIKKVMDLECFNKEKKKRLKVFKD